MEYIIILSIVVTLLIVAYKNFKRNAAIKKAKKLDHDIRAAYDSKDFKTVVTLMTGIRFDNWYYYLIYSHSLFETGDIKRGREFFSQALSMASGTGDISETKRVWGLCEFNAKNYYEAIKLIQSIEQDWFNFLNKIDDNYQAIEILGNAFMLLGNYDTAIETFKRAPLGKHDLNSGLIRILKLQAECYEKLDNKKAALKIYNKIAANNFSAEIDQKIKALQS